MSEIIANFVMPNRYDSHSDSGHLCRALTYNDNDKYTFGMVKKSGRWPFKKSAVGGKKQLLVVAHRREQ